MLYEQGSDDECGQYYRHGSANHTCSTVLVLVAAAIFTILVTFFVISRFAISLIIAALTIASLTITIIGAVVFIGRLRLCDAFRSC